MSRDVVHSLTARPQRRGDRLAAGRYYGDVGGRYRTSIATLTEVVHATPRALPEHDHACAYFCMLVRGHYSETVADREFAYSPFDVGFHPALTLHRDIVGPRGGRFLCIELDAASLDSTATRLRPDACMLPSDITLRLVRLYRAMRDGTLSAILIDGAAWDLCADVAVQRSKPERSVPRWLRRCLEVVESNQDIGIGVGSIARDVGVHPVHLSREFRRRYGQTLGEYAHKVRIRRACAEIAAGERSLARIAASAGFADQSHFCRVFKRAVGCTPSAYVRAAFGNR